MNIHENQPPIVEGDLHVEVVVCDQLDSRLTSRTVGSVTGWTTHTR